MAGADREPLAALLQEVQSGNSAVQQMLSDLAAREGVVLVTGLQETDLGRTPEMQTDGASPHVFCPKCGFEFPYKLPHGSS